MKVTFVYIDRMSFFKNWRGIYHFGIGSLSAILKEGGHQRSLIHITGGMSEAEFIEIVKQHSPDLLAFTSTTISYYQAVELISWVKKANLKIPVICGGIHATLQPEEVINTDGVDIVCQGEGEYPLLDLCNAMEAGKDYTNIPNLWIKNNGKIIKNSLRPLIKNLDDLPFADRSIYNLSDLYFEKLEGELGLLVSRGCPFNCSYCSNHALRNIYKDKGKYVRFRSVDSVIAEIKELRSKYGFVKKLLFYDDILFQTKSWMEEFVRKYNQEVGLPYSCNVRPNLVNEEIIDALKATGCYCIRIGLESGNEYIRNEILNRRLTDKQMRNALSLLKKAGLDIWTFNMLGMPDETPARVLDTIKMNADYGISQHSVGICYPFRGTKLYELARDKKLLTNKNVADYYDGSALKLGSLNEAQILMFEKHFDRLVFLYRLIRRLPKPFSKVLGGLADRIFSSKFTPSIVNFLLRPVYFIYHRLTNLFSRGDFEKA
jgi:radical SAM superfamily enzyme YgiQ (UPF0313 family)